MRNEPHNPKIIAVCWVVCCALIALSGCQRRVYTDLYAESMAGEIRELEDRIYEYDAAYQGIEDELAILQSENGQLHDKLTAMQSESPRPSTSGRTLFKGFSGSGSGSSSSGTHSLRETHSSEPESFQVIPKPDPMPSVVPTLPPKSLSDTKTPSVEKLPPAISPSSAKPVKPKAKSEGEKLEPPIIEMGAPSNSILPPSGIPKPSGSFTPSPSIDALPPPIRDSLTPPPINNPLSPPPNSGTQHRLRQDHSVQAATFASPQPSPSLSESESVKSKALNALPDSIDDDAVKDGKIELPNQIQIQSATYQQTISNPSKATPKDTKVLEIAFHPTLCRGQFLDSKDRHDGIYLVLQPRNASGEIMDMPATLTVVALDPNRPDEQSKIGRWTLTKEEVDAQLEPVGIGHGFHIPLQWQAAKPSGDAVQVYVRYEMPDGRRLVNERRIQLHVPSAGSATWTPRVSNSR